MHLKQNIWKSPKTERKLSLMPYKTQFSFRQSCFKKKISSTFLPLQKTSTLFAFLHPDKHLPTVVSWSLLNSSGTKSNHFQRFPSSRLCTKIHFYMIASNKNVAICFVFCRITLLTNKKLFWYLIPKKWRSLKVSYIQNELTRSLFLPKSQPKITEIFGLEVY